MLKIIGHHLCPYVQRVIILMLDREIAFERIDIDLDNKPQWLVQYSPTAKVPLLITEDKKVLFESQVIFDYLDEILAGSLQPNDSYQKARHRAWCECATGMLNLIANIIYRDHDKTGFKNSVTQLQQQLKMVETEHSGGSYFAGDNFYLIDVVYATLFRYFAVLQKVTRLPILEQMPKLSGWQHNLSERPCVKAAVSKQYNEQLIKFITNKPSYLSTQLLNSHA